jgi:hypothetical protein
MRHIPLYIEYHYQDALRLYLDQLDQLQVHKDSSSNNKLKYRCHLQKCNSLLVKNQGINGRRRVRICPPSKPYHHKSVVSLAIRIFCNINPL